RHPKVLALLQGEPRRMAARTGARGHPSRRRARARLLRMTAVGVEAPGARARVSRAPGAIALSSAPRERLDALGGANEGYHDDDAEPEQDGLQDMRAEIVEPEQDRQRPAAGKRRAEHFRADQD